MISLKITFVLVAISCVRGDRDLDELKRLIECGRQAIITGVPELNIPKHTPLQLSGEFHHEGVDDKLQPYSLTMKNAVWRNIEQWDFTASQVSHDEDEQAIFNFTFYWKEFLFQGTYDYHSHVNQDKNGTIDLSMKANNCTGILSLVKPTKIQPKARFTNAVYTWHFEKAIVDLGSLTDELGKDLIFSLDQFLNGNQIVPIIFKKAPIILNEWANDTARVDGFLQWCKNKKL